MTHLMQILANPATESEANREGIVYVVSRIDFYSRLSFKLLKNSPDMTDTWHGLEEQLLNLFKALLRYEMKSVCSYYRNQGFQIFRDFVKVDDWNESLERIHEIDSALQADIRLTGDAELISFLDEMRAITKDHQKQIEMQVLQALFVIDPKDEIEELQNRKDQLIAGCWKWICDRKEFADFRNWDDQNTARLLWITGSQGKGKTMLLIAIVQELERLALSIDDPTVSYFFVQGTPELKTPTAALRCVMWMLLIQQPSLISHFREKFDAAGKKLLDNETVLLPALTDIFRRIVADKALRRVYLIVDALDECFESEGPGRIKLVDLITSTLALSPKIKWLVSSWYDTEIEYRLSHCRGYRKLDLDSQIGTISKAVSNYIDKKLSDLDKEKHYNMLTRVQIAKELRTRAKGTTGSTFLWVSVACRELQKVSSHDALATLRHMPRELENLYAHLLRQISGLKGTDPELCKRVLAIMTLISRPIHLFELAEIVDLPPNDLTYIIWKCASFLLIQDEIVYCLHPSANEYLRTIATPEIFPRGNAEIHGTITWRLLQAMSDKLRRNIYNIRDSGYFIHRTDEVQCPTPDPLLPIRYACLHWVDHLIKIGNSSLQKVDISDNGVVDNFLRDHFLHWLEALSLMKSLSIGREQLKKLESLLVVSLVPSA